MNYALKSLDFNNQFLHPNKISKLQPAKYLLRPWLIISVLILLIVAGSVIAQSNKSVEEIEREIRKLEEAQIEYLMSGNVVEMKKNWAPDYTVNNHFNLVQNAATGPIQIGSLTYSKFERNIEKILIHDSTVIVMGNELVVPKTAPKDSSHDTKQPIKRRFTNVWMRKDSKWLMIARHANEICSN